MQHVKKRWLSVFAYGLVGLDVLLFACYLAFEQFGVSEATKNTWGITELILIMASLHAGYVLIIFPFFRKKMEWLASIVSISLYAALFAAIIDTSGNTNLSYRLGYAGLVFLMGMSGVYAPTSAIILTWLIMLFTYSGVVSGTQASVGFNFAINLVVTVAGVTGWLFFRRYYEKTKDAETIALSKLLEQEQFKTNVLLESITDGVMIVNTLGTVQVLNKSAAEMLGWNKAEALKLNYKSLIVPFTETASPAATPETAISLSLKSGKPTQQISLLQTHNQRHRYFDIVASPIYELINHDQPTAEKKIVGVIAVLRDVDEQKRQEQQRSEFISTASHEMRTPVAAIQGFVELALNPKVATVDEKARGYLEKAHDATQHLGELFQDLLTVSKSEDGRLSSHPEVIEVRSLLQTVIEQGKLAAEAKGLKIVFDSAATNDKTVAPLLYVNADPARLSEVITNLLDNAIKYTQSGLITIGASLKEQSVVIRVSDTGMGIAEEDIPHLFQKFYRTDNSATREIGGTGLGLYICKQIVETMGGKIWVESTVGAGSTFYVEIPRVNPEILTATQIKQP